jgi:hypothetical protein
VLIGGTSVLYDRAVLDVVQLAATCSADVTFAWFASASITDGMLSRAITKKMPSLAVIRSETSRAKSTRTNIVTDLAYIILGRACTLRAVIYEMLARVLSSPFIESSDEMNIHLCHHIACNDSLGVGYFVPPLEACSSDIV